MADVDTDPFGEQESRTDKPIGEDIPLISGEGGVPTWEPKREKETSFGGTGLRTKVLKSRVEGLYQKLSESMGGLYQKLSESIPWKYIIMIVSNS